MSVESTVDSGPTPTEPKRTRRLAYPLAVGGLVAVQLLLIMYFQRPFLTLFIEPPQTWIDYDTHVNQTFGVVDALERFGRTWAYDAELLAGSPEGTLFDCDNKGWELLTFAFYKMGLPRGTAFNLYILLAHLLVPWVVLAAARLFGLDKWTALLAAGMGLVLWFFDAYPRWIWWVGMTAYGLSGYFFLLPLALFYRYLLSPRWHLAALLAATLILGHLNHPYIFVILVFPMAVLYTRSFKRLALGHHLALLAVAAVTVAANAYWLVSALRFWHYIMNCAYYCQSTLSYFVTDYLGLLKEPLVTGVIGSRTGFRFVFFFAAVVGLHLWRKERDERFLAFAVGLGAMLCLAYLGGYSLAFSQIQPYRHAMPAMYFTLLPAAVALVRLLGDDSLRRLPRITYAVGGLGLLVAGGNLARDALYFLPERLPEPRLQLEDEVALKQENPDIDGVTGLQMDLRHEPTFYDFNDVANWLIAHDKKDGRILVEWWILGEHLAWRTNSHILGGFLERNVEHTAANLFRRELDRGELSEAEIRQYLIDYAVKWVLVSHDDVPLVKNKRLFTKLGYMPPVHKLYATTVPVSFFAENDGRVAASQNRIDVRGTDPAKDVVLRFHWMETLVCAPGCAVTREPLKRDPVGFIRVKAPHPADFAITNSYEFD